MKTKQTYKVNSETVTSVFDKAFKWIQNTKVSISSKSGKDYMRLPFIIAFVIAIIFPFLIIMGLIAGLAFGLNISFEREIKSKENKDILRIN